MDGQNNTNNTGSMACDGQGQNANLGTNHGTNRANEYQDDARTSQNFHGTTTVLNVHSGSVTINNYFGPQDHGVSPFIHLPNFSDVPRSTADNGNNTGTASVPTTHREPETSASSSTTQAARRTSNDHAEPVRMPTAPSRCPLCWRWRQGSDCSRCAVHSHQEGSEKK
jgi:hypothetical protein